MSSMPGLLEGTGWAGLMLAMASASNIPGLPEGTGWAGLIAAMAAGLLWLRQYLSGAAVTQASNVAQTDLVNMLREQIALERSRADAAEHARDEAIGQIGELKNQVAQLTAQVQGLKTQLAGVAQSVSKP